MVASGRHWACERNSRIHGCHCWALAARHSGGLIVIGVGSIEHWTGKNVALHGNLYAVVASRLSDLASEQSVSILYVSSHYCPQGCRIENIRRVRLHYTGPSVVISLVIGSPMGNFGSRN